MKHFKNITCATIQLDFPKKWGDPTEIVDKEEGRSLSDAIWKLWADKIGLASELNKRLAHMEDVTNGFDISSVRFEMIGWKSEAMFDRTIEFAEKAMHEAYAEVKCQS